MHFVAVVVVGGGEFALVSLLFFCGCGYCGGCACGCTFVGGFTGRGLLDTDFYRWTGEVLIWVKHDDTRQNGRRTTNRLSVDKNRCCSPDGV